MCTYIYIYIYALRMMCIKNVFCRTRISKYMCLCVRNMRSCTYTEQLACHHPPIHPSTLCLLPAGGEVCVRWFDFFFFFCGRLFRLCLVSSPWSWSCSCTRLSSNFFFVFVVTSVRGLFLLIDIYRYIGYIYIYIYLGCGGFFPSSFIISRGVL